MRLDVGLTAVARTQAVSCRLVIEVDVTITAAAGRLHHGVHCRTVEVTRAATNDAREDAEREEDDR
jgi:hypothetical protein